MTGGGTGRCLQTTEAGGMGEGTFQEKHLFASLSDVFILLGWSDTMAEYVAFEYHIHACATCSDEPLLSSWLEKTSADVPDFILGQYVENNTVGIRTHPYSTNAYVPR
jgi:extracellular elastinolytic metalloproteinase